MSKLTNLYVLITPRALGFTEQVPYHTVVQAARDQCKLIAKRPDENIGKEQIDTLKEFPLPKGVEVLFLDFCPPSFIDGLRALLASPIAGQIPIDPDEKVLIICDYVS